MIFGMGVDIDDRMPIFGKSRSQAEASRDSALRGGPLHVYYIQFRQYAYPMGSGRPPRAAGELYIVNYFFFHFAM